MVMAFVTRKKLCSVFVVASILTFVPYFKGVYKLLSKGFHEWTDNEEFVNFEDLYKVEVITDQWIYTESDNSTQLQFPKLEKRVELRNIAFWKSVNQRIGSNSLYDENDDVTSVLHKMRIGKIIRAIKFDYVDTSNSLKWILFLSGGQKFIFKPRLTAYRHWETCVSGCENPESETGAFVLDRLLGYRKVPYSTGRLISVWDEILPVASEGLKASMKYDPGTRRVCVTYTCIGKPKRDYCFVDGIVQGALIYWINYRLFVTHVIKHPFHRAWKGVANSVRLAHEATLSVAVNKDAYCRAVQRLPIYRDRKFYMDLTDIGVLDYLTQYRDRKHTLAMTDAGPFLTVHIDNGYSFCPKKANVSTDWRISPVRLCCRMRRKTFQALNRLSASFNDEFRRLSRADPLYPLATDSQMEAVQGRLLDVLSIVQQCTALIGQNVFVNNT